MNRTKLEDNMLPWTISFEDDIKMRIEKINKLNSIDFFPNDDDLRDSTREQKAIKGVFDQLTKEGYELKQEYISSRTSCIFDKIMMTIIKKPIELKVHSVKDRNICIQFIQ